MQKRLKPIKVIRSKEKLSNRIGVPLIEELVRKFRLRERIDEEFGKPGSNRGIIASDYIMTLVYMFVDGALHLEDVRHLMSDEAFQEMLTDMKLPTSDAIGDWLGKHGGKSSETKIFGVIKQLLTGLSKQGEILDIDATIIESDKGDSQKTYKGSYGYQPLLGIISENGIVVGSDFREGNVSPQSGLVEFIKSCRKNYPQAIKMVRSDSAGWQKEIVDYCQEEGLDYTITTDQTEGLLEVIKSIPEEEWTRTIDKDGIKDNYEVAETEYRFGSKKRTVRIAVKRTRLKKQYDLFLNYSYWIVATNLSKETYDSQAIIELHQGRGLMEKKIGELKNQLNLDKVPCGQFDANCLYFTIGLLAYNLLQMLKYSGLPKEDHNKSVRTLRYQLLKLAGKVVFHARYLIVQIAAPLKNIEMFNAVYYRLRYSPLPA
ncbi:MAG: IS1380 family transposase [Melioribacteraceae bacterium]